ncbi:MAG: metallophosphoesterase family protein [Dokdonella sp.]|uniref:metallophosphoesterase family protein n=1 Tax=Dokdonella sp. TaxID=2291710 RepID=UPI0025B955A9|nr:metallophosphoesterase family protein [Dokdonella sp.]MBX3700524.1 metallophosphoesterase family protein [Dokdonella sp.]MCW5577547.1 metallophosphoesterase family protein [Dokdonella sp.]
MRIGLLADLHANREATEACLLALADAGCTQFAFLGDLVGYGADPGWVVDCVREHVAGGAVAVQGNHDAAVDGDLEPAMNEQARVALQWTRDALDADQRRFLRELPLQVVEEDRLYAHANAFAPGRWAYVYNPLAAGQSLKATPQWLTLLGHVHDQAVYYTGATAQAIHFQPVPGATLPLLPSRRWLAIVGSCGQPRDGNPAAACAWLDTQRRQLGFLRVPYDHERAAQKVIAAGLPAVLAQRLLSGR